MSGRVRICRPDGSIQTGYRKTQRRNRRRRYACLRMRILVRGQLELPLYEHRASQI